MWASGIRFPRSLNQPSAVCRGAGLHLPLLLSPQVLSSVEATEGDPRTKKGPGSPCLLSVPPEKCSHPSPWQQSAAFWGVSPEAASLHPLRGLGTGQSALLPQKSAPVWDICGGPVAETLNSQCRGAWVRSLIRQLDPTRSI